MTNRDETILTYYTYNLKFLESRRSFHHQPRAERKNKPVVGVIGDLLQRKTSKMSLKVGQRVEIKEKGTQGVIAYIGHPGFATGKWIGVILDEAKGKNNGTIKGQFYFKVIFWPILLKCCVDNSAIG